MLGTLIVAACAGAYLYHHWARQQPGDAPSPLAQAFLLLARDDAAAAIDVLDQIDTRTLDARGLGQWLNLKANALALADRSDEALDLLDDLQSVADDKDAVMQLCIVGNRGLAHLRAGRLELAAQLLDDTEAAAQALAGSHADFARDSLAETWYWRATLAERRSDTERRRECLTRAAGFSPSLYAAKARAALHDP